MSIGSHASDNGQRRELLRVGDRCSIVTVGRDNLIHDGGEGLAAARGNNFDEFLARAMSWAFDNDAPLVSARINERADET